MKMRKATRDRLLVSSKLSWSNQPIRSIPLSNAIREIGAQSLFSATLEIEYVMEFTHGHSLPIYTLK